VGITRATWAGPGVISPEAEAEAQLASQIDLEPEGTIDDDESSDDL
jgi:hypothetical protein